MPAVCRRPHWPPMPSSAHRTSEFHNVGTAERSKNLGGGLISTDYFCFCSLFLLAKKLGGEGGTVPLPRLPCSGGPLMVRVQVALSTLRSPTGLLYHQQLCCNARIMALMGRRPGVELVWDWIEWIKPYLPYLAYFTLFLHYIPLYLLPSYLAYTLVRWSCMPPRLGVLY